MNTVAEFNTEILRNNDYWNERIHVKCQNRTTCIG